MKNTNKENLLKPIAFWTVLTIAYGIALSVFGNYELTSLFYHIGLLVITLYFARTWDALGFKVGNSYRGIAISLGFLAIVVIRSIFLVKPTFNLGLDLATFTLVFFAPVTEELFWRGFLLRTWLADPNWKDPSRAIISNALFFVLMHLPKALYFGSSAFYFVSLIPYGFLFAACSYATKSVYYPAIMHIIQNVSAS